MTIAESVTSVSAAVAGHLIKRLLDNQPMVQIKSSKAILRSKADQTYSLRLTFISSAPAKLTKLTVKDCLIEKDGILMNVYPTDIAVQPGTGKDSTTLSLIVKTTTPSAQVLTITALQSVSLCGAELFREIRGFAQLDNTEKKPRKRRYGRPEPVDPDIANGWGAAY